MNIVFGYISTYAGIPGMVVGTAYYSMTFTTHAPIYCPITEPAFVLQTIPMYHLIIM
jgi:hypothetical protein